MPPPAPLPSPTPKRTCGTCSLCCKLVPVEELGKPSNKWCPKAKPGSSHSCTIYNERPQSCRLWSCLWLESAHLYPALKRPDQSHYVIDIALDTCLLNGKPTKSLQIWEDPGFPGAWRSDLTLVSLINLCGQHSLVTAIRHGSDTITSFVPPHMSGTGEWHTITQKCDLDAPDIMPKFNHLKQIAAQHNISDEELESYYALAKQDPDAGMEGFSILALLNKWANAKFKEDTPS